MDLNSLSFDKRGRTTFLKSNARLFCHTHQQQMPNSNNGRDSLVTFECLTEISGAFGTPRNSVHAFIISDNEKFLFTLCIYISKKVLLQVFLRPVNKSFFYISPTFNIEFYLFSDIFYCHHRIRRDGH